MEKYYYCLNILDIFCFHLFPDLKTLLSCANTGHMQMDVFGRINEIAGRVRGMHECQDGSDNDNRMFSKMCWYAKFSLSMGHFIWH